MAPYRARLGGAFGGGTQRQERPQIDVASIIDAIGRGATTSIQNAYLRKRQNAQDKIAAEDRAAAKAQAEQLERERFQDRMTEAGERAARLQLERDKLAAEQARAAADAAKPKPPVRGTPEYMEALEAETRLKNRLRPPTTSGATSAASKLNAQISTAQREVPRLRPIEARPTAINPDTRLPGRNPVFDPAAEQRFVADSTAKAADVTRLRTMRGDFAGKPSAQPQAPAQPVQGQQDDPVLSAVAWIRANPQKPGENDEAYKARYRAAVGR